MNLMPSLSSVVLLRSESCSIAHCDGLCLSSRDGYSTPALLITAACAHSASRPYVSKNAQNDHREGSSDAADQCG
jgi:hypothetical protein